MAEKRFEELSTLLKAGRYRNVPPESVREEFIEALPELKARIGRLDKNVKSIMDNAELLEGNLRFLEKKCDELESQNFAIKALGHDKLNAAKVRNDQLIKCFMAAMRELGVILATIQEKRNANVAASRNAAAANLEILTEHLIMRKTEITELFKTIQSDKCEEIIADKRKELATKIQQKHIQILNFKMELVTGRIAYDRFQRHDIFKKLPSEFIQLTLAEYANGQIDIFSDNCRDIIISLRRMESTLHRSLDRWNSRWIHLRQDSEEMEKKIADVETALQFWEHTVVDIGGICNRMREDRETYAHNSKAGAEKEPPADGAAS